MTITFDGCTSVDVGTVVTAPTGYPVNFKDCKFFRVQKIADIYYPGALQDLGLPADLPKEDLRELLLELIKNDKAPEQVQQQIIAESKLGKWLSNFGSITTIGANLITFVKEGIALGVLVAGSL